MHGSASGNHRCTDVLRVAKGYAIALVVVAAAVAIKLWVTGRLGREAPFLLLLSAVSVSTWLGGRGPGLFSAVLTTGALASLFLPGFYGHRTGWLALHTTAFGIEAL